MFYFLSFYYFRPSKNITVGTDQALTLNVSVENHGEDSYLTQYYVTIPPGFEYSGLENYETKVYFIRSLSSSLNLLSLHKYINKLAYKNYNKFY